MNAANKFLFMTSPQKVLLFLAENAGKEFQEKEIAEKTGVKKSAVNLALRELFGNKIIARRKIGRSSLYMADINNNVIKEIKVLRNIAHINPLIERLKKKSKKIVIFGSFADGTNREDSDIDLFILSEVPGAIRNIINNSEFAEKIQLVAKTQKEMIKINKNKPLLFQEIEKGKVLWEESGD